MRGIDVIRFKVGGYNQIMVNKKPGFSIVYGIQPIRYLVTGYRLKDSSLQPKPGEAVF